jgi:hypothetical protein
MLSSWICAANFGQEQRLRGDLAGVAFAWLRGGSVFMLRFALFRSAGDVVFRDLLAADALVYAGYSAGACILSSTLRRHGAPSERRRRMTRFPREPR